MSCRQGELGVYKRSLQEKSSANGDVEEVTQSDTGEQELGITKAETNTSVAETFSLPHEIIFVAVICLAQLFTRWVVSRLQEHVPPRHGVVFTLEPSFRFGRLLKPRPFHIRACAPSRRARGRPSERPRDFGFYLRTEQMQSDDLRHLQRNSSRRINLGAAFSGLFALEWWLWTFWCFSIVLAAVVVIGFFAIPSRVQSHRQQRARGLGHLVLEELDMPGTLTGVAALVLINLAWNQAPIAGWSQPYVYVTLIIGLLILAVFFVIEIRYATHPLIPFNTLPSDVSLALGAIACGWGYFGIWVYYSWQFLLVLRTESAFLATAHFSPVAISGAVAAILTGALMHLGQTYRAQTFGIAASLVSTVVNYSISIALGFAGTVDVNANNGRPTELDVMGGYRGALYMAIGLAGLGVAICLAFSVKTKTQQRKLMMGQDKAEAKIE
ncbi:hypothetical protein DL768_004739 [Monosporascus sp. mg162]|nr:hypothetical protein DL768_004739 [Monosporascus sp. mg162]